MSSLPPIKTEEDYSRLHAEMNSKTNTLLKRGNEEKWSDQQLIDEIANLCLPYELALTEPDNPVTSAIGYQRIQSGFAKKGVTFSVVQSNEYPELQKIITEYTARLNVIHGTSFKPPTIVMAEHMLEKMDIPAAYSKAGDMMLIDPNLLKMKHDRLAALMGHELSHRWQRSPEKYLPHLKSKIAEALKVPDSEETKAAIRAMEADADFGAAQLAGPVATRSMLKQTMQKLSAQPVVGQFFQEKFGVQSVKEAEEIYLKQSETKQKAFIAEFNALSPEAYDALVERTLKNAPSSTEKHPKWGDRAKLQETLAANPELLTCRVTFDGSANILSAEECGPGKTTMKIPQKQAETPRK